MLRVLYGPQGEVVSGPTTLLEFANTISEDEGEKMLPVIEALVDQTSFLQAEWGKSTIVDHRGRPFLRLVE